MKSHDTGLRKNIFNKDTFTQTGPQCSTNTHNLVHRGGKEKLYTFKLLLVYVHNKPMVLHLKSCSICSRITSAGFILLQARSWRECEIMFYYATAYSCTATHEQS